MSNPSGRHVSPWIDTMPSPQLGPTAFRQVGADVVVIGAGIVGITTAFLLQREGKRVVVVDAQRLGHSVTTHSTVKVTVGHGTLYSKIEQARGLEAAAAYAQANVTGMEMIADVVRALAIDCQLEVGEPHVIYAEKDEHAEQIHREAEVAGRLGLPTRETTDVPLPFAVAAGLAFERQAMFHPARYLLGLAEAFVRDGGVIIEGARAQDVDEDDDGCSVQTTAGTLSGGHVVVATQYPILNRGGQFAWLKARRSYGIAGVLPEGVEAGMTINVSSPTHSTRTWQHDGERLLIVVGEGHEVGHVSDTAQRWVRLQQWAAERFGVEDVRYHWSAEETTSIDHVPFVGHISPGSKRVFTACGFDGWGMTNGTAAGMQIRDHVLGRGNPWADVFDARRAEKTVPGREFVKHNVHVGKTWLRDRVGGPPAGSPQDLEPGDAAILDVDGEQTAVYRDDEGTLHAVSPVCTHMACNVEWNGGERSWDCPCHGSRFDVQGNVLHGPASRPLERRELP